MHKSALRWHYTVLPALAVFAGICGYRFALAQLHFASPENALASYPQSFFLLSVVRSTLTFFALFLFLRLLFSFLIHCIPSALAADLLAFLLLLALHIMLSTSFSPLNWDHPLLVNTGTTSEELAMISPIFSSFGWAKLLSFSTIDYSEWAGILNPPVSLDSPLLQMLAILFDLPAISIESYQMLFLAMTLGMIVMGSFGTYLFLRYATKLHPVFAFCGGCLFFFGGAPLVSRMVFIDSSILLSAYAAFPYALMGMVRACEKRSNVSACWAGAALASPFFLQTPHPEAIVYAILSFSLFSLGMLLFSPRQQWRVHMRLIVTALLIFLLLCAFSIFPILMDTLSGAMHTSGHIKDIGGLHLRPFIPYFILLVLSALILCRFFSTLTSLPPVYAATLYMALMLSLLVLLTSSNSCNRFLVQTLNIQLHVRLEWRIGIFFYFSVACAAMMAMDMAARGIVKKFSRTGSPVFLYTVSALILISLSAACGLLPLERITDSSLRGNPEGCRYYITLQSLLASEPLLAKDKASLRFIRKRIDSFEHDLHLSDVAEYRNAYAALLAGVNKDNTLDVATAAYPLIDQFYLDNRNFCINPLYDISRPGSERRVLAHNTAGLYLNLPDPYSAILYSGPQMGPVPGLFIHNQTTTLDTRFITGMPLLTALYVLPTYDFADFGQYGAPMTHNYFSASSFSNPVIRKTLNIGGIDIFTLAVPDRRPVTIQNTKPFSGSVNPLFDFGFQSFMNTDSYGRAYLAHHVTYETPETVAPLESVVRHYFALRTDRSAFTAATAFLYQKLMALKEKHDVIVENLQPPSAPAIGNPGELTVKAIAGDRVLLASHCLRTECEAVLNVAYASGWHAFVNGRPSALHRANFAFLATSVAQGESLLWFIYEPLSQLAGYGTSILTLIGVILYSSAQRKNQA